MTAVATIPPPDDYARFLQAKVCLAVDHGFYVDDAEISPVLKPHQRAIVRWMMRGGCRACFAAFGLGKTMIQLEPGEFFAFGPAFGAGVKLIKVGPVKTSHPKAGSRIHVEPPPPTDKVKKLLPQLSDLPAEAEERAKSIEEARKEIAGLKRQLTIAQRGAPLAPANEKLVEKRVEVPVLKDGQVARFERAIAGLSALPEKLAAAVAPVVTIGREISAALGKLNGNGNRSPVSRDLTRPTSRPVTSSPIPDRSRVQRAVQVPSGGLTRPQQRILDALAWLESVGLKDAERPPLGFLADASSRSSAFMNNLGALRSTGMIVYPREGTVALTDDGRAIANAPDAPLTPEELQRAVLAKVTKPQGRILEAVISVWPDSLTREEVGSAAEASTSSSAFMNNLGFLRGLGLIDYPASGQVKACPVLFLEN